MEKGAKIALWTLGIGGALTALFFIGRGIYKMQMQKLNNFCYGLSSFKLGQITANNVNLTIDMIIGNKSAIDFTISKYNLNVIYNGKAIGTIVNNSINVIVPSKKTATLSLDINFNPSLIIQSSTQNILGILTASSNVVLGVNGNISASALGISVTDYPINISTTLDEIAKGGGGSTKCVTDSQGNLIV